MKLHLHLGNVTSILFVPTSLVVGGAFPSRKRLRWGADDVAGLAGFGWPDPGGLRSCLNAVSKARVRDPQPRSCRRRHSA